MPTDLTERLAGKLGDEGWTFKCSEESSPGVWIHEADHWLPLLLSEPELVAGLAPEVKVATLKTLIQDMRMQAGYYYSEVDGHLALVCPDPIREGVSADDVRLSVLTPRERAVMKLGEVCIRLDGPLLARTHSLVKSEYRAALAEARALTTEGKDGKGVDWSKVNTVMQPNELRPWDAERDS